MMLSILDATLSNSSFPNEVPSAPSTSTFKISTWGISFKSVAIDTVFTVSESLVSFDTFWSENAVVFGEW